MEIREILVVLRSDRDNAAVLDAATMLAREHRAFLQALCAVPAQAPSLAECYAIGEAAVAEVIDHLGREQEEALAQTEAAFRASLAESGVDGHWSSVDRGEAISTAPLRARLIDMVVMARPSHADSDWQHLAEAFLMEGGSRCLFVPDGAPEQGRFRRVVIAWSGTREAKRALDDALPLLGAAEAIRILTIGHSAETPVAGRCDAIEVHLARHGHRSEQVTLPAGADVAGAILENCRSFDADLLVMGAFGHNRTAEALFGGTSRSILQNCPIPLLMGR